jgi:MATE family multidrug resistance protein
MIRTGNFFGARDPAQLRLAANTGIRLAIIFMTCCALLLIGFHQVIPWLFLTQQSSVDIASQLILVAALFQVADGVQVVLLGALRGINDVRFPTIVTLIAYWIIALPLAYFLAFVLKLQALGIWLGLSIGLFFAATALYFRLRQQFKLLEKELPTMEINPNEILIAH